MPPGDIAPVIMMAMLCAAAVMVFRGPVGRAIGRRLEGSSGADRAELGAKMAELEHRLSDIEHDRARVAELEERLDFAERLLAAPPGSGDSPTRGRP